VAGQANSGEFFVYGRASVDHAAGGAPCLPNCWLSIRAPTPCFARRPSRPSA
jgi:hypothetical protein